MELIGSSVRYINLPFNCFSVVENQELTIRRHHRPLNGQEILFLMSSLQQNSREIQVIEYKDCPYLHSNNYNISVAESIPESAFGKAFTTFKPCPKCQNDTAILHKVQHFHGAEFRCEDCDLSRGYPSKRHYRDNPIACWDTRQSPKRSASPLLDILNNLGGVK